MADELRINLSAEEKGSEAREFEVLPGGKYWVKITDGEVREVVNPPKPGKQDNRGKPYWRLEHVIQDGPYEGRMLWNNVMLFAGAGYTLVQILKATGHPVEGDSVVVPPLEEFIGEDVFVTVKKMKDAFRMDPERGDWAPGDPPIYKNEISGYLAYDEKVAAATGKGRQQSMLP